MDMVGLEVMTHDVREAIHEEKMMPEAFRMGRCSNELMKMKVIATTSILDMRWP
jgi:hypothetical protein